MHRLPILSAALAVGLLAVGVTGVVTELAGFRPPGWLSFFTTGPSRALPAEVGVLLYNALGIWLFGRVVEGRVGWWKFLIGLSLLAGAAWLPVRLAGGQADLLLGGGLSPLVTGVLAIAAFWAPGDEVTFDWYWYSWREPIEVRVSYGVLAVLAIGCVAPALLLGGSGAALTWSHLLAFLAGLAMAWAAPRLGVAPRDGRDLIKLLTQPPPVYESDSDRADRIGEQHRRQRLESDAAILAGAQQQFRRFLAAGNAVAACKLHDKLRGTGGGLSPSVAELKALVGGLHKAGRFRESAPFMADLIRRAPDIADPVRLKLAQVCVAELERPGRALDLLDAIDRDWLAGKHRDLAARIRRRAEQMQAHGAVEIDDGEW